MKSPFVGQLLSFFLKKESPAERAETVIKVIEKSVSQGKPGDGMKFLLELDNRLYGLLGNQSILYGEGVHTKHRHIGYHDFFIANLAPGDRVLDIGSGNGLLCYEMAKQVARGKVVGIEINERSVEDARKRYVRPNLCFIHGDAGINLPEGEFDVVTMSNVLEHIEKRVELLKTIVSKSNPDRIILRVPHLERDWKVPLKKELGVEYRLDPTHCIEYTLDSFQDEITRAGLEIADLKIRWGEIWSLVRQGQAGVGE
jgi:2-polyprenyl-3-methyl-5-hydroxy-6-metoxy-1,4-benzoquinol methylase